MKDFKPYIILAIILVFAGIFIAGCLENPQNLPENINGIVYTVYGNPESDVGVSIGDYPIIYTDHLGQFQLPKSQQTYNLVLNGYYIDGLKYLGLKNNNPKVNYFGGFYGGIGFSIVVNVPRYTLDQALLLKFISDDISYSHEHMYPWSPDTTIGMGIYFNPGYTNTHGKLIYLLATVDFFGRIISYDAFGMKDVTLTFNVYNNFTFTSEEVSYNPDEATSNVFIDYPFQNYNTNCNFYIHFNGKNKNSDLLLGFTQESYSTQLFPVLPFIDYSIKSESSYFGSSVQPVPGTKWVYTNSGEDINVIHKEALALINPADNRNDVTDTTTFSVNDDGIKGIYIFSVIGIGSTSIVADKNMIRASDFNSRGFKFSPGKRYLWWVTKYPHYNSIDEFTSINFIMDERYDYIQLSEERDFKTGNF